MSANVSTVTFVASALSTDTLLTAIALLFAVFVILMSAGLMSDVLPRTTVSKVFALVCATDLRT